MATIVLYDVIRDGIGYTPWLLMIAWATGAVVVGRAFLREPKQRAGAVLWLTVWVGLGGFGFGNVVTQYLKNRSALRAGTGQISEGTLQQFHRQTHAKGSQESFVVGGTQFEYSDSNLGGGGMRSSQGFDPPLENGLYVKVTTRGKVIIRLECMASPPSPNSTAVERDK